MTDRQRFGRSSALVVMWILAPASRADSDFLIDYSAPTAGDSAIAAKVRAPPDDVSFDPFVSGRILVGDGKTDNTVTLNKLLSEPGRTVVVRAGDYVTGSFSIAHDVTLILERGVTLRDSGQLGPNERLMNILSNNVRVVGYGAKLLSNRATYAAGEQRHGVFIFGATGVTVEGLESSGQGGDGFYIGGPIGHPASEIHIINCAASNNRRQGMSITNASNVLVQSSTFSDTAGTAPQAGVDLEPDRQTDRMDGIRLVNIRTEDNKGGGILVVLGKLGSNSAPVDVVIINHQSRREGTPIRSVGGGNARGSVRYVSLRMS